LRDRALEEAIGVAKERVGVRMSSSRGIRLFVGSSPGEESRSKKPSTFWVEFDIGAGISEFRGGEGTLV